MSYHPFTIQVQDQTTEKWTDLLHLHARKVNKSSSTETDNAGAEQFHVRLTFETHWCQALENAVHTPQLYRIVYKGRTYNIQDYDDFMEQHRMVKLVGESYG